MVTFKATTVHFSTTMCLMNKLRQEKTFCDITLTVGTDQIQAHRCVLAAGSPYFQSLFLGHFTEAAMKDINLSEVTHDVYALEMIIDFIYTGEIDINIDNLGVIVKLSSFFLVGTLRDFCIEFMTCTLCLRTCLRYYLYAVDHGLSNIEAKTQPMVQSRFHDFLIFEEETLKMSPDELLFISKKNILEHCTSMTLLQFIARWVEKGLSERHVSVGTEVLDAANSKGIVPHPCTSGKTSAENAYDRVKSSLEGREIEGSDKFLRRFNQMLTKSLTKSTTKCYNLRGQQSSISHSECEVAMETAIITFSPRPCVIETFKKKKAESISSFSSVTYTEPIMDMCAYIPRTKCWYHMHELNEDGIPNSLMDDFFGGLWRFQTLPGDLAFINNCGDDMGLYNLKSNTWRYLAYGDQTDSELERSEIIHDLCVASGNDNGIYMVAKVRIFEDDEFEIPKGMYFRGYKLQDDQQTWHRIFQTATIDLSRTDFDGIAELCAKISSASNEMLVIHSQHEHNVAFVVNLNDEVMVPCTVLATANVREVFQGVSIVEGKNQLYIVSDGTQSGGGCVNVKFEYRFNSNILTEVKTPEKIVQQIRDGSLHKDNDAYPCLTETSAYCGESLWYLEGNREMVSFLTEVTVNRNRTPVNKQHTPPPFSCFVGAFATKIDPETLTTFRPITKFLYLPENDVVTT